MPGTVSAARGKNAKHLFPRSNLSRAGHASRVEILRAAAEGRQSGLLTDSVVMTDNLATVIHTEIHRVVGSLPMDKVAPLLAALPRLPD